MSLIGSVSPSRDLGAVLLAMWIFPASVLANGPLNYQDNVLKLDLDHIQRLGLLPPGMMDDEALFAAADAARRGIDWEQQFNLNLVWLLGKHVDNRKLRNRFNDRVLSTIRHYLISDDISHEEEQNKAAASQYVWNDFDRFRIRLEQDEVTVQYVMKF